MLWASRQLLFFTADCDTMTKTYWPGVTSWPRLALFPVLPTPAFILQLWRKNELGGWPGTNYHMLSPRSMILVSCTFTLEV